MKTKYIISWVEFINGKKRNKTLYSLEKAIIIGTDIKNGTLFEKAKSDTVQIKDTESGIVIIL